MAHDVLISYSSRDKLQADAICNRLESRGIRCWIAPRDVGLGEYAASIVQAIEEAKVMVLVFSANADKSDQVKRELERAVSKGITIVPVRIEEAEMSQALEFYVSSMHWLDAITPPLEEHIDRLAEQLKVLLARKGGARTPQAPRAAPVAAAPKLSPSLPSPGPTPSPASAGGARNKLLFGGLGAVAAILLLIVIGLGAGSDDAGSEGAADETPAAQEVGVESGAVDERSAGSPASGPEVEEEPGETAATALDFVNETWHPVEIYWVGDRGREELYETLEAGEEWTVESEVGSVWVVRLAEAPRELPLWTCETGAEGDCVIEKLDGGNLAYVEFHDAGGEYLGAFVQTGPGKWVEEGAAGEVRFRFVEQSRDEWSVYLFDESRSANIELDLWLGKIMYSDANNDPFPLQDIADASD